MDIEAALGNVSVGWDLWTAPHTSDPYFGLLVHWIDADLKVQVWTICSEVAACHKVIGKHNSNNLGLHLLLFLDHV